ncbi:MAG: AAA family ATPase, partial [Acidobacteriota bacterium]
MEDIFLKRLVIQKVRHLKGIEITLSDVERKHLILTGKNGSGKTSLLEAINRLLPNLLNPPNHVFDKLMEKQRLKDEIARIKASPNPAAPFGSAYGTIENIEARIKETDKAIFDAAKEVIPIFNDIKLLQNRDRKTFITHTYSAYRKIDFSPVSTITKITYGRFIKAQNEVPNRPVGMESPEFIQYLINLRNKKAVAYEANQMDLWNQLENYFKEIENIFKRIFGDDSIEMEFNLDQFEVLINQKGREKYTLRELPAGYASLLKMVIDILMNTEIKGVNPSELQGVVLIDEIENHLHVELQKQIFPLLISIFPKIQFIISTHSPFVVNSIENAIVYDLEKQIRVEDLSGYSYEGIVESYFDVDKYSTKLKDNLENYRILVQKEVLPDDEKLTKIKLESYLENIPSFLSK